MWWNDKDVESDGNVGKSMPAIGHRKDPLTTDQRALQEDRCRMRTADWDVPLQWLRRMARGRLQWLRAGQIDICKCLGTGVRWGIHPRQENPGGDVYTGRGVGSDGRWPTFIFPSPILTEPLRWVSSRRFVGHDTWRHTVAHFYSTLGPWPICIQIINCSLKLFYSNNLRLNIPSCISYK